MRKLQSQGLTDALPAAAAALIADHDNELDEIADRLIAAGPLDPDPHVPDSR